MPFTDKNVIIIGSGFAGLSAACFLAKAGCRVTVLEQHSTAGGRARIFAEDGFTFDMGPSWYWMPDVFERFFGQFGKKVSDYYELIRLSPSYEVFFEENKLTVPANMDELYALFEQLETGSSVLLQKFLAQAAYKYEVGMNKLVHSPSLSLAEFVDIDLMKGVFKLDVFKSMHSHIRKHIKHPQLIQLLEFPTLFLGALPQNTPALYSLMNYADMQLGTWYPQGGMYQIVQAMYNLALELGVTFRFNETVSSINMSPYHRAKSVTTQNGEFSADVVLSNADYHFTETTLLPLPYRSYSEKYWEKRTLAPSCLLFYVGIDKVLPRICHHSLFFDSPFYEHAEAIYTNPKLPVKPLFYACCPSKTDPTVAPSGCENLFLLIPLATELRLSEEKKQAYFEQIIERLEQRIGENIRDHIIYKKHFDGQDFISEYNAFKGNAYGLANTLGQTAILKPRIKSKKVKNLYFTGQLTVPGPGVPPSLISGEVVAKQIISDFKSAS